LTVWCSVLVPAVAGAPIAVFVVDGDAVVLDGPHATRTTPIAATAIPVRVFINSPFVAGSACTTTPKIGCHSSVSLFDQLVCSGGKQTWRSRMEQNTPEDVTGG